MSYAQDQPDQPKEQHTDASSSDGPRRERPGSTKRSSYRDEIYSLRVPAGKRTYFFDVKATRSGKDFFLTITESKRVGEGRYEKHKLFLYKEDFGKFLHALHDAIGHVRDECLPDYDFDDLPELTGLDDDEYDRY